MLFNLTHLQVKLTPEAYGALWPTDRSMRHAIFMDDDYWQNLPRYLIARCPLCGHEYQENLDTYTLFKWNRAANGKHVFHDKGNSVHCEHFVRVHHFINFNGIEPKEKGFEILGCEVPHLMQTLLPDDVGSWAVMHALPICRMEEEGFVPQYTVYMLTYYAGAQDVEVLMDRLRKTSPHWEAFYPPSRQSGELWWDLTHWVREGRLFWLAPDLADLPIQRDGDAAFPYGEIQGRREPYHFSYRSGSLPPFKR